MGTFEFIIALVLIGTVGSYLSDMWKVKHGYPVTDDMGNVIRQEKGTRSEAHEARIEALEKRIRVLERIATDRGIETAEQIDALRQLDRLASERKNEEVE